MSPTNVSDLPKVVVAGNGVVFAIFNLIAMQLYLWPYPACGIIFSGDGSFYVIPNSGNWFDRDSRPHTTEGIVISPTLV
ncbi:hypothetical protein TIFTF001_042504 [Ficus carica]|uniref:Uncharacterized protein n=1 Tax=Ficus carica TaxID=3494 RepID=A0AA87ZNW3_FICCA|nr:hypothetical protein TIFTF001_042499 [Ficus carica]GMN36740.1 hypothetical protein TIFTF001_042500 [Ficus carica]GMN36759.1 hypothetical protein TIFTF001_042503 [Ficus carica]GMN36765.1 hypothetical protein TIFTF001_042504 [Ficus carica]